MGDPVRDWLVKFNRVDGIAPYQTLNTPSPGMTIEDVTDWANAQVAARPELLGIVGITIAE